MKDIPKNDELFILEKVKAQTGYANWFENIISLTLFKNGKSFDLTGEEAELLYKHLRPALSY